MQATGIILAGGKSSRMGTNKALLKINGVTTVERIVMELKKIVDEIIIVTNSFEDYAFLNLPMVEDHWKGMGPLAGIHAGLTASKTEKNIVVACDMPFISYQFGKLLLQNLAHYQAAVPEIAGQLHPLFAAYRKEVKGEVERAIQENQLKIRAILQHIHVKIVKDDEFENLGIKLDETFFYNMNHPNEYENAINIFKNRSKESRES